MSIQQQLKALADRWADVPAGERANYQLYLTQLATALDVPPPEPKGSGYEFEYPIRITAPSGKTTTKFVDLYRRGYFLLEAKDESEQETREILMRQAFGQARQYAGWTEEEAPPYLLALDVARTLIVWDRWSGSYGDFHAGYRIHLPTIHHRPDDIALLRDIWTNPAARDPRGRAEAITRDVAARLAEIAGPLESRGHDPEIVARFLIRCVFTMFAEDIGLLPDQPFQQAVQEIGLKDPTVFPVALQRLWEAMDTGSYFGLRKFLRFNGHFFTDQTALPLELAELRILLDAAKQDWSDVEPSIMGTLLTRALDPTERHQLGAEYTPREFVERLVRPTVEEPIRERWTRVQAEILQLRSANGKAERTRKEHDRRALESLRSFHQWLRSLRFLDPASGSGNFLYVTLKIVKEIEYEVLRAIEEITGQPELGVEEVGPWQFYGIEVKPWARELAELTLWIGYHQWWRRTHGHTQPPEPVLRDTGTLELRDAVLEWDEIVHLPAKDRPDPTPRIPHPVTGNLVPDPAAKLPYYEHRGARQAPWVHADFIVGNPPYIGQGRMREAFGDGYVDALRAVYPDVPHSADFVMYWWHRAAEEVAAGRTIRAGLITTNTITQAQNRVIIERAAEKKARVTWAIADHVWYDGEDGAEVRVAMTVIAKDPPDARLLSVEKVDRVTGDVPVIDEVRVSRLNADLTAHADVAGASRHPLLANAGLSSPGLKLHGSGFILSETEATALLAQDAGLADIIRPYRNGRDLTARPRGVWLIDFGLRDEVEAGEYPVPYNIVRDRVKPERDANQRETYRTYWWRFGEPRREWRAASAGLSRYIATTETSKHRFFTFLDAEIAPDNTVIAIASDDAYVLGVLSSRIHQEWALAAGGRMGVRDTPRYNKGLCFDPFPFAEASNSIRQRVAEIAMRLEAHRNKALAANESVTMMKMYDVVDALRTGRPLTASEQAIHVAAACGVLMDLHDELDAAVAAAYGWPWPLSREEILDRLVELHDERIAEEAAGTVRWLRPEYQVPKFGRDLAAVAEKLDLKPAAGTRAAITTWPNTTLEQIAALQQLLARGPVSIDATLGHFSGARREHISRHLETLALMGEATTDGDGLFHLRAV